MRPPKTSLPRCLRALLCALCLLLAPALGVTARAATLLVTNASDSGTGSLRAAVASAAPGDTINFQPGLGTITLTGGQITLGRSVTIAGPATVSGSHSSRVFEVTGGTASAPVTLTGLTLQNGSVGGGGGFLSSVSGGGLLNNGGAVTLTNCALSNDSAAGQNGAGGGLCNIGGTATLTGCTLTGDSAPSGQGGGLYNSGGAVTLTNCALSNDSAADGGGLINDGGTATLTGCTLTGDSAPSGQGGGLYNYGGGAATLTNCALTGDSAAGQAAEGGGLINYGTVTLAGCTLSNDSAAAGGGLFNGGGTMTLAGCALTGDSAPSGQGGGLYNYQGTASLTDCALAGDSAPSGSGGGLINYGTVMLAGCTLSNDSAAAGGGLFNGGGTVTLAGCALTGDSAAGQGGNGGGLYNYTGTAAVTGCTFTGDSAQYGGGLLNYQGTATLTGCTLTGNSARSGYGGGLFNNAGGTATLTDDILYGDSGGEVFNSGTATVSFCDIQGGPAGGGNISADPQFVTPYASAGAPFDLHLRAGSPCAGAGTAYAASGTAYAPAYLPYDIDGRPRPTPGYSAPSIGAYESAPTGAYSLVVENTSDALPQSLRAAVQCANDYAGAAVTFDPQAFTTFQTVTLTSGQLTLSAPMTITAPAPGVAVSGNAKSRVFEVKGGTASAPVALLGLTVENGAASNDFGGGVEVDGGATAALMACTLTQNTAGGGAGGGLFNGGTLTLTACALFADSASGGQGGGLFNGGALMATGCTLTQNSAPGGQGGGLYSYGGRAALTDDILYGDSDGEVAQGGGGAVTASYSDIGQSGGYSDGGHDFNRDPLFVSSTDLHVQPGSPVVGAGVAAAGNGQDITGMTRANPPAVGAYEGRQATATTLGSSPNPSDYGRSATFTATVTIPGGPAPAGSVAFYVDGSATPAATVTVSGTTATYATSGLSPGQHTVTATFRGPGFVPSTSAPLTQTVRLVVTNTNDSGAGSLRGAVASAGAGATVPFAPGLGTITLTGGQITLGRSVTIAGPATVDGSHSSRVFEVTGGTASAPVTLTGLTLQNGSGDFGGGVEVDGGATAALTACTLTGNSSGGEAGGLDNSGTATLTACTFVGNTAVADGGGLGDYGRTTVVACVFAGNSASQGGAISSISDGLTLTGCTLTGNRATSARGGGGFADLNTPATLTDDILYGDTGGEVSNSGGTISASYCDIGEALGAGGDGVTDGGHNLSADPQFVTPYTSANAPSDLHPRPGSPVTGAGVAAAGNGTDITGATRANPPTIGAYEGQAAATRTTLQSSLDPSDYGQGVTFTVTVQNTSGGSTAVPTGTVTLFGLPGGPLTLTLSAGGPATATATYTTSALPSGTYSLIAVYTPAGSFAGSATATPLTQTVLVNDRTTLTSSLNPSSVGQSVTFTATVDTQGGPAPQGTVSFYVDGSSTPAATVTVSGTTASYATSGLSPGPHAVTATFTGAGFVTSSAALTQTVATSISGTVTLTGWLGTGEPTPQLAFTLTPAGQTSGGTTQTLTPTATSNASTFTFTLPGVAPGSYTLGVKGALWLREDAAVNVSTAGASGANVTLPPGDVSGDNVIDGNDTALLRLYFNTVSGRSGFNPGADLNGDGVVDGNDTALLRAHFNAVGRPF